MMSDSSSSSSSSSASSTSVSLAPTRSGSDADATDGGLVSSTCTWHQSNSNGMCTLTPRSCFECLNEVPTSGESCTLNPDGICLSMEAYDASQDYRRPGTAYAWPVHYNYFPSNNTTYCGSNDMVCSSSSCRDNTLRDWGANPSVFCAGADECVCVAVCESSQWTSLIQEPLAQALTSQQGNGTVAGDCVLAVNDDESDSSSFIGVPADVSSSSDGGGEFVGIDSTKMTLAQDDPCMWYQNQSRCGAPRSCYDCLNRKLYNGQKCMLHASGYCTSIGAYDPALDYREALNATTTWGVLFPSSDANYCGSDDAQCATCRVQESAFLDWRNTSSQPQFCLGANDCVCLASCESPFWHKAVVELTCNLTDTTTQLPRLSTTTAIITTALGCLTSSCIAVVLLCGYRRYYRQRRNRSSQGRAAPRATASGPQLALSGWKAMRERLIEDEREFMAGGNQPSTHDQEHSIMSTPPLSTTTRTLPSGLAGDAATASTSSSAVAVVVEPGDAYRPLSPSRMHQ